MNSRDDREFREVKQREWDEYVKDRRPDNQPDDVEEARLTGLAISGGGIRSATFSLGVLQRLAEKGVLSKFDYLSTVSGGGYIGGSVSFLANDPYRENKADPLGKDFPYGAPDDRHGKSPQLRHLLRHGSYLTPGEGLGVAAFGGMLLRAIAVNLLVWLPLLLLTVAAMSRALTWTGSERAANAGSEWLYAAGVLFLVGVAFKLWTLHSVRREKAGRLAVAAAFLFGFIAAMYGSVPEGLRAGTLLLGYPASSLIILVLALAVAGAFWNRYRNHEAHGWRFAMLARGCFLAALVLATSMGYQLVAENLCEANPSCQPVPAQVEAEANGEAAEAPKFYQALKQVFTEEFPMHWAATPPLFKAAGWFTVFFGALVLSYSLVYAMASPIGNLLRSGRGAYLARRHSVMVLGWAITSTVGFALIAALPFVSAAAELGGGLSAFGTGVVLSVWKLLKKPAANGGRSLEWLAPLAAFLVLYGLAVVAYYLASEIDTDSLGWLGAACAASVYIGYFTSVSRLSIGRYYRDRLMEAFMPDREDRDAARNGPATMADQFFMTDLATPPPRFGMHGAGRPPAAPLHIVNTLGVFKDSRNPTVRDRGGDSVAFTPLSIGGPGLGWHRIDEYMDGKMTLATAVATSAAAVSPNAGPAGTGLSRNRAISVLMALFNVRLGLWAPNPKYRNVPMLMHHLWAGWYELAPFSGYREDSTFINLTDGGHFENLAMYELFRRRVKLMVVVDAGADPNFEFGDLQNALHLAQEDFGVSVRFTPSIDALIPREQKDELFPPGLKTAPHGVTLGTFYYEGDDTPGYLFLIKTTLIKDMSMRVKGYKGANPTFPDESTGDQFFDDDQFEAYRVLGAQIAEELFDIGKDQISNQTAQSSWLSELLDASRAGRA